MRSYLRLPFLVLGGFFLLLSTSAANAQCGVNTLGFGDAGLVAGNPFHAEIVVTRSGSTELMSTLATTPRSVARDSQGRVRSERVTGEFKHDNGVDAGKTVQGRLIMICDPVAQTLTEIDTLNATAKIIHSRPSALSVPGHSPGLSAAPPHRTFCSSRQPSNRGANESVEDLGDQTIEGIQAHGVRITLRMAGLSTSGESLGSESVRDVWCSDDLSAVLLTVSGNAKSDVKNTIAMQNIQRSEPDAALFQIPADYAITESVPEPHVRRNPNLPSINQR